MKGFFDVEKTVPYKSGKGVHSCVSCGLYKYVLTPRMKPYGKFKKGIMVLGEAPGESEDKRGKPWQGKAGRALQRKCKELGINLFEDCVSLNAVNCHPTDKKGANRTPTEFEIACCRQKVINAVNQYKPKIIILLGGIALSSLIGYKWKSNLGGIMKWRGWTIPDQGYNAWVCPTFHPSFVERQEEKNEVEVIWTEDLRQALGKVNQLFLNYANAEDCVHVVENENEAESVLAGLNEAGIMAFDIETTGLKPYNKNSHEIVSISFCNRLNEAWAMPFPKGGRGLKLLKRILQNPKIGKVAANMKFENNWLDVLHGIEVSPWKFDTMQAAHILDNRPGITGLKFQSYVRFGVLGYDEDVSPFLKSPDSNTPNRIMELVRDKRSFRKLLLYNGIDSLMTYRLALLQMMELERGDK